MARNYFGAVGQRYCEAIGVRVGAHQMVTAGLGEQHRENSANKKSFHQRPGASGVSEPKTSSWRYGESGQFLNLPSFRSTRHCAWPPKVKTCQRYWFVRMLPGHIWNGQHASLQQNGQWYLSDGAGGYLRPPPGCKYPPLRIHIDLETAIPSGFPGCQHRSTDPG